MTLRWVVAFALLAGCSDAQKRESKCRKIAATVCDHQLECQIVDDVFECDQDFQDSYTCDPSATLDDLDLCIEAAKQLECPTSIPFVCFEVLCDPIVGCNASSTTVDTDTDTDTQP